MPTGEAQAQSFSLANVVPQNRTLNRSLWAAIEESTRRLATRRGQLFVVTGPVYAGDALASINGRVLVPSQMFKAIYDPVAGEGGAYLAPNDAGGTWQAISLDALRGVAGIDAFPSLSPSQKASAMTLPEPRTYSATTSPTTAPRAGSRPGGIGSATRPCAPCTAPCASCSARSSEDLLR